MRKLEIYVETSVWGMLANDEPFIWREAAEELFTKADEFDFYISPVVVEEINNAADVIKQVILDKIIEVNPKVFEKDGRVDYLVRRYIEMDGFTEKQDYDAAHVAYASINDVDIIASFNYKHIVRYQTKNIVKSVNILEGYHVPDIVSPLQLL